MGTLRACSVTRFDPINWDILRYVKAGNRTQLSEFELMMHAHLSAYLPATTIAGPMPIPPNIRWNIVLIVGILLTTIIPKVVQVICALYVKQPYHTSILSGEGCYELFVEFYFLFFSFFPLSSYLIFPFPF